MRSTFLIIIILSLTGAFGQTYTTADGDFEISLKGSNMLSEYSWATDISTNSSNIQILKVKLIVKSTDKNPHKFDINAFSLVDTMHHYRYRPIDANYPFLSTYINFTKLIKGGPGDFKWDERYQYKPDIKDTFTDFNMEGYQNIEFPINFGSTQKPDRRIIYYEPMKFTKKTVILFFPIFNHTREVALYYGKDLILKPSL